MLNKQNTRETNYIHWKFLNCLSFMYLNTTYKNLICICLVPGINVCGHWYETHLWYYHPALKFFVILCITRKLYLKGCNYFFLKCQHQIKRKWKKAAENTQVLVANNVQDILLSENNRLLNCAFNMFPLVYKRVCVPVSVYIYALRVFLCESSWFEKYR